MDNEIIVVKQLPVIQEQLQQIKAEVTAKVESAKSLVCTQETLAEVKRVRAELRKDFNDFEERRKEVKAAIMKPYNDFDTVYKECITDVFKNGDEDLKAKIDSVENTLKEERATDVKAYFDELCQAAQIDFVTFENANINITLSASMKGLKEQAAQFVGRICDDLNLIAVQEHKDEILFLYKKVDGFSFLNVSKSITFVAEKYKAIEAEKAKEAERQAKAAAVEKSVENVEKVVETLTPPTVEETEPILTLKFTVRAKRSKLRELKEYLERNGFDYE